MVENKILVTFALVIELIRHIEILLLSNDCVIVPDFGGFMAHHVDAKYDDRDNMFLPPLRTVGFNPQLKLNDSVLALSYVEAYDISYPDALNRIANDVNEIRTELENTGKFDMNDIGTIYLNSNGNYSFEPCEAGLLTPNYYGLGGFTMSPLKDMGYTEEDEVDAKAAETIVVPIAANREPNEIFNASDHEEEESKAEFIYIKKSWLRNAVAACIAIIVFFALSTPLNTPNIQKSQLDTGLLNRIMPKEMVKGEEALTLPNGKQEITVSNNAMSLQDANEQEEVASMRPYYSIVLASRVTKRNAANYAEQLQARGYKDARVLITSNNVKVVYGTYETEQQAYSALNRLHTKEPFTDSWITQVKE